MPVPVICCIFVEKKRGSAQSLAWMDILGEDKDMKRRILSVLVLLLLLTCSLTGCVTEATRDDIIEKLEKEGIIEDDWEFYCFCVNGGDPIPWISSYDYVYFDDEDIYVVNIRQKDENEEYTVQVGEAEEISEQEYINSDGETIIDHEVIGFNYSEADTYKMKYVKFLWFKYMKIIK